MVNKFKCPVCDTEFISLRDLNIHLDKTHPVKGAEDEYSIAAPIVVHDKTSRFSKLRGTHIERVAINRTRLELRLVKLLVGLQRVAGSDSSETTLWTWRDVSACRKFERQTVNWEDGSVFDRCRFCGQKFSFFVRKHHCRICGLVTCGDVERECSLEAPANLLAQKLQDLFPSAPDLEKVSTEFPVRLCTECRTVLFGQRNYQEDVNSEPSRLIRLHFQLEKLKSGIVGRLPEFEELLATLSDGSFHSGEVNRVRKARQDLLKAFSRYEHLTRKIRDLKTGTETENRIRMQMLAKAALFLESAMLPLQSLPQAMGYNEPKLQSSKASSVLQNKLVVLEEQRFLLENQIAEAKQNRHFDALSPMEASLKEIDSEARNLSKILGQNAPTA